LLWLIQAKYGDMRKETCPVFVMAVVVLLCLAPLLVGVMPAQRQKRDSINAGRVEEMLQEAHDEVKKNYCDVSFHGLDWDSRYREYTEKMKQVTNLGQGFAVVAGFLDGLNDSHTFFLPPQRPAKIEYGFQLLIVGDKAFIHRLDPEQMRHQKYVLATKLLPTIDLP